MVARLQTVAHPVHVVGRAPLLDRLPGLGPPSGIATGLEATFTDANLFVGVGLPFLTQEFLEYLPIAPRTFDASAIGLQNWVRFSALPGNLAADAVRHRPMSRRVSIEYSWIN
jgi:hypothetical protein